MYFRIFLHYIVSLKTLLQAENGPLHIQNISCQKTRQGNLCLSLQPVPSTAQVILVLGRDSSAPQSGPFFVSDTNPVFCCVHLYVRDSIPTFQNHLSSSTFLPKTPSPAEVWGLFTTVSPCHCRHHRRGPSQTITYSPSSGSAVWRAESGRKKKKEREKG